MKTKKRNKFFTFCLSFLPGAAEMYMGFMKMGVSLMGLFFGLAGIAGFLNLPILLLLMAVIWFYGFFHANNLAALTDSEFDQIPDDFLFGAEMLVNSRTNVERYRKWFAIALMIFGAVLLWNTAIDFLSWLLPDSVYRLIWHINSIVPKIVIGVIVIWAGLKMIRGKQRTLFSEDKDSAEV